ncbi:MAG TPA: hypothetical protein VHL08_01515 [Dongiaceae bacterium]|jgi:hypothetical protein|nr:hypothetical protein [Dongiaceae bacterium]
MVTEESMDGQRVSLNLFTRYCEQTRDAGVPLEKSATMAITFAMTMLVRRYGTEEIVEFITELGQSVREGAFCIDPPSPSSG